MYPADERRGHASPSHTITRITHQLPHLCSWLFRVAVRTGLCQLLRFFCVASAVLCIFLLGTRYSTNRELERSQVFLTALVPRSDVTPRGLAAKHPLNVAIPDFDLEGNELPPESHERAMASQVIPRSAKRAESRNVSSRHPRMPLCPLNPPGLVGLSRPLTEDTNPQEIRNLFPEMEKGGRIRPANCTARQRLAIIIPFRNRHPHLYILLRNLIPFLRKQMVDATIFIIEQAPPSTFNRGALLNIGFLEALKTADFDCFLLHDVDLVPLNDRNFYRCGDNPHHFASAINKYRYRLKYEHYVGGVIGFSREQFIKVNGNSNLYFGWGAEDDDLSLRIKNKNYTIDRHDAMISRYLMIKHVRDAGNSKNTERSRIMKSASERQDVEGVNSIKYKVNSIKLSHLSTWINVSLNMTEILDSAPEYTKKDMWKLLREIRNGNIQR